MRLSEVLTYTNAAPGWCYSWRSSLLLDNMYWCACHISGAVSVSDQQPPLGFAGCYNVCYFVCNDL